MQRFPPEFSELLSRPGRAAVEQAAASNGDIRCDKLVWLPQVLSPKVSAASVALLEESLARFLRPVQCPIPRSSISGMRRAYTETLPKTISNSSINLNPSSGPAVSAAKRIGLLRLMQSDSLLRTAERLTGFPLLPDPGLQVLCYGEGDYVGPHNDHHPDAPNLRRGYVDLHLTLSNEAVAGHTLVYESDGFLNKSVEVGVRSGLAVSFLPFWHYTTPLAAKRRAQRRARRWLILTSFSIAERPRSRRNRPPKVRLR
jgi:hypothetical protein